MSTRWLLKIGIKIIPWLVNDDIPLLRRHLDNIFLCYTDKVTGLFSKGRKDFQVYRVVRLLTDVLKVIGLTFR